MGGKLVKAAIVAAAFAAVLSAGPATAAPVRATTGDCIPVASWGTLQPDLASAALTLINQHRTAMGLAALKVSPRLTAAANWKSLHMAGTELLRPLRHQLPDRRCEPRSVRPDADMRLLVQHVHGREHRGGVPDGGRSRARLARLAGPPGEHRESKLRRHRDFFRRRRGDLPLLLDAGIRRLRRQRDLAASTSAASATTAASASAAAASASAATASASASASASSATTPCGRADGR